MAADHRNLQRHNVVLYPPDVVRLKAVAFHEGRTMSDLVREAITRLLDEKEKRDEAARRSS